MIMLVIVMMMQSLAMMPMMLMMINSDREVLIWCLSISLSPRTPDKDRDGDHEL